MEHSFNTEIAQKHGMKAAVLYRNFQYWIAKNKVNNHNFRDGRTWTYNSWRALTDLFPYMSVWDVRKALKTLIDAGILLAANYNVKGYDRTTWYAFEDEKTALKGLPDHLWNPRMSVKPAKKPLVKSTNGLVDSTNGLRKFRGPIPDDNPNRKPDDNKDFSLGKLSKADAESRGYSLLIQVGVAAKVAKAIVFEHQTPLKSIEEAIKNGLAKGKYQAGFVLEPGYVVAALNGARKEGKVVKSTKKSRKLKRHIAQLNKQENRKPLSKEEFEKNRENVKKKLAAVSS